MNQTEKLNENIHKARLKLRRNWEEMLKIYSESVKIVNEQNLRLDKYLEEMMIK